jgi:hypothetical protein
LAAPPKFRLVILLLEHSNTERLVGTGGIQAGQTVVATPQNGNGAGNSIQRGQQVVGTRQPIQVNHTVKFNVVNRLLEQSSTCR